MGRKLSQAEAAWRGRMARFRRGKETVAEFCRREGVSVPSFYHWRKRLELERKERPRRQPSRDAVPGKSKEAPSLFLPVHVTSSPVAEIELPNGVRVRIPTSNVEAFRAALLASGQLFREESPC